MLVSFGEWRPDVADLNGSVASDVRNVLCADGSYIPFPLLKTMTVALPADITGAFMAKSSSGQVKIFAGAPAKLYAYDTTTMAWVDVSKTAAAYQSSTVERWQFAQYGDRVVAVNANDPPQSYLLGVDTSFSDLLGSPPLARHVAVWGDFLVLGGLLDFPNRVQWSSLDNPTEWIPGTNNGDYQDFPDGGPVQGMTSANNPIIMQEYAIRGAVFVPGSDAVFTFNKLADRRGTKAKYSLAYRGDSVFFLAEDGFYQVDYSGSINPIGFEKVDRYFIESAAPDAIVDTIGVVDPIHSRVYWAYSAQTTGFFDSILIYDWLLQRWSRAEATLSYLLPAASPGYTLEQLDTVSSSIDEFPASLDSRIWAGGAPALAAFDGQRRLAFFAGLNAEATLTTQEVGGTDGGMTRIASAMPVVDTDQVRVSYGARFRRQDDFVWTAEAAPSSNTGIVRKRSRARYHRFKTRILPQASWTHAQGVDIDTTAAGMR